MSNPFDEILKSHKGNQPRGIASICSAHPWVLRSAMQSSGTLLIESTCNQVNQFGGYTGMTPQAFVAFVHDLAGKYNFPSNHLVIGADHLGPYPWHTEPAGSAMAKAEDLVRSCVQAGYTKIHVDASMKLGDDDLHQPLDVSLICQRTAQLVKVAETVAGNLGRAESLRYVVGSEVPSPGGATLAEAGIHVTQVNDVRRLLDQVHSTFIRQNLAPAWERTIALVVQPGVEFGTDYVHDYHPAAAQDLVRFIETTPFVFEAHSTDYQTVDSLRNLVHDHFAILKVGPALTFAFRQAVFSLVSIEAELLPPHRRSHLVETLEQVMQRIPGHWVDHYHGSPEQIAFAQKYSLSDRMRYYWSQPEVQSAFTRLLDNLRENQIPLTLVSQFFPHFYTAIRNGTLVNTIDSLLVESIRLVLHDYEQACGSIPLST